MARKIHPQEECLFCDAYPCACGKPPAPAAPEPAPIPTAPAGTAEQAAHALAAMTGTAPAPPSAPVPAPAPAVVTVAAPALAAPPSAPQPHQIAGMETMLGSERVTLVDQMGSVSPWAGASTDEIIDRLQVVFPGAKVERP